MWNGSSRPPAICTYTPSALSCRRSTVSWNFANAACAGRAPVSSCPPPETSTRRAVEAGASSVFRAGEVRLARRNRGSKSRYRRSRNRFDHPVDPRRSRRRWATSRLSAQTPLTFRTNFDAAWTRHRALDDRLVDQAIYPGRRSRRLTASACCRPDRSSFRKRAVTVRRHRQLLEPWRIGIAGQRAEECRRLATAGSWPRARNRVQTAWSARKFPRRDGRSAVSPCGSVSRSRDLSRGSLYPRTPYACVAPAS